MVKTRSNMESSNKKDNGYKLVFFELMTSLLLFANFLFDTDYLSMAGTLVVVFSILTVAESKVLPLAIYYSFFSYLFYFSGYALYVFVAFALLVRFFLVSDSSRGNFVLLLVYYILIHLLSSLFLSLKMGDVIPFVTILCLYPAVKMYHPGGKKGVINAFFSGYFLSSFLGFFKEKTRLIEVLEEDYVWANHSRDSLRFAGLSFDPNFYSIISILALCILMFGGASLFKKKALFLALTGATVVLGVITFSKSLIICYIVIFAISLFNSDSSIRAKAWLSLLLALSSWVLLSNQISAVLNLIGFRFSSAETVDEFFSGRIQLWSLYWNEIVSSSKIMLIGAGANGKLLAQKAAHNTFLEIIYKFGFFGLFINIVYFIQCSKLIKRPSKMHLSKIVCVFVFLALLFNLSAYSFSQLWVCLFFMIILVKESDDETYNCNPSIQC